MSFKTFKTMWFHFQLYQSLEHVILAQGQRLGGGLHFPDVSSVILMSELPAEAPEPGPTLGAAVVLLGPPGL